MGSQVNNEALPSDCHLGKVTQGWGRLRSRSGSESGSDRGGDERISFPAMTASGGCHGVWWMLAADEELSIPGNTARGQALTGAFASCVGAGREHAHGDDGVLDPAACSSVAMAGQVHGGFPSLASDLCLFHRVGFPFLFACGPSESPGSVETADWRWRLWKAMTGLAAPLASKDLPCETSRDDMRAG